MKAVWMTPSASAAPRLQAVEVFHRTAMDGSAGLFEGCGAGIRAGEAEDLVAGGDQFLNDGRADEAGGAGNKDTHEIVSIRFGWRPISVYIYPGK